MARQIYELRSNLHYSYDRIGRMMYCPATTVYAALRRYEGMQGDYVDRRKFNGRKNWKLKIVPRVQKYLLDPKVLQGWSNLCLQQRCV